MLRRRLGGFWNWCEVEVGFSWIYVFGGRRKMYLVDGVGTRKKWQTRPVYAQLESVICRYSTTSQSVMFFFLLLIY